MSESQMVSQAIELSGDGFMLHPEQWTEDIAVQIARKNSIPELTDDHWAVIRYVRKYYLRFGFGPGVRMICRRTGLKDYTIHELFHTCTRGCMCRIAGLPKPTG